MFLYSYKPLFLAVLMISSFITVSANTWLGVWMGLEINLLSFIPLMKENNNLMSSESSLKYFLAQALASSVLLFSIVVTYLQKSDPLSLFSTPHVMVTSALLLKSGMAPFHSWFPVVVEGLSWVNVMILITWQKLAPLMVVSYLCSTKFIMVCIILSAFVGSLGGLNQVSLRKLIAYSSINHLGWIILSMSASEGLWLNYFVLYCFLSVSVILIFYFMNMFFISQLFSSLFHSLGMKISLFTNILSLGGLPPFLGFYPKWMVIQIISLKSQLFMISLMVMFSLITLFFYLRLSYSAFTMGYLETNWTMKCSMSEFKSKLVFFMSFVSFTGFLMITVFFMLY
nr:NADH dehydrogenase subunit 2 [Renocera pallida]